MPVPEVLGKRSPNAQRGIRDHGTRDRGTRDRGTASRVPVHVGGRVAKAHAVFATMTAEFGRNPTPGELAEGWVDNGEGPRRPLGAPEPSSLERSAGPAGEEERAELGAFLADDSPEASPTDRAVEALETARARRRLGKAIAGLEPQEHTTVIRRYGLDAAKPRKSSSRSLWRSAAPACACGPSSALRRRGSRRGARRPGRLSAPKAFVHGSTRRGRFPATAKAPAAGRAVPYSALPFSDFRPEV